MLTKQAKYIVGFSLIAAILLYLALTSFKSSLQYYVTVSELEAKSDYYSTKVLKVAGHAHNIQRIEGEGGGSYSFIVDEGGKQLSVTYKGIVPDTFKEGSDVVVTGRMEPSGNFIATEILAKCASKYEAKMKP